MGIIIGSGAFDDSDDVDYVDADNSSEFSSDGDVDDFEEVTEPPVAEKSE